MWRKKNLVKFSKKNEKKIFGVFFMDSYGKSKKMRFYFQAFFDFHLSFWVIEEKIEKMGLRKIFDKFSSKKKIYDVFL